MSLQPAAKAEAPQDRFQLHKLPPARLSALLKKLGGIEPQPLADDTGGAAATKAAAAAHQAALVAAMRAAMAEAPLALLDEATPSRPVKR